MILSTKISSTQFEALAAKAKSKGMSVSALVRKMVVDATESHPNKEIISGTEDE